ncbi:MAG: hypothetical protein OXU42_09880 [Deltaproteobacteria bacterium]|nr:hypothetical protein [Deltaproteobacteria bacterium]
MNVSIRYFRTTLLLALACLVPACAEVQVEPFPEPIRPAREQPPTPAVAPPPADEIPAQDGTRTSRAPGVVIQRSVAEGITDRLGEDLVGDPIQVSFHNIPLVAFINEIFGEELKMSFVISPGLRQKVDLVTLKLTEPLAPRLLFATARRVLREFGVDIVATDEGILTFVLSQDIASRDVPLFVSGRALPDVPPSHRVIFQLVPLKVVRGPQVRGWLSAAFDRQDLEIIEDPDRNALLLKGNSDMLVRALAMIEVLDQPLLRGRYGVIVEPVFMRSQDLAKALNEVLHAEGYQSSVGTAGKGGSIILLALPEVNKMVAFAGDQATLDHVEEWARILDTGRKESIETALFTYEVRNTQAEELTETLNRMLTLGVTGKGKAAPAPKPAPATGAMGTRRGAPPPRPAEAEPPSDRIVVDKKRNMLLFRGSGKEWAEIRSVIEKLDKSVPLALIEVLIAEVTLTDQEKTGIEYLFRGSISDYGLVGKLGGLGIGESGLSVILDSAGETRALLNLFYRDDRVVIRSRPRLLVKSGETATIDVGNEIPVITRISDDNRQSANSINILQDVTYRKTGVQLEIKPIVQANGLVDLQISQQLSEARPTAATSLAGTPTILNRQISTSLTLRDGGSLLLGGLISGSQSAGETGVPILGQLPQIGRLFRADSVEKDRTELMIMVTPYVITDHEEGWELTRRIRDRLELHSDMAGEQKSSQRLQPDK